jgi:hypothetical protein
MTWKQADTLRVGEWAIDGRSEGKITALERDGVRFEYSDGDVIYLMRNQFQRDESGKLRVV